VSCSGAIARLPQLLGKDDHSIEISRGWNPAIAAHVYRQHCAPKGDKSMRPDYWNLSRPFDERLSADVWGDINHLKALQISLDDTQDAIESSRVAIAESKRMLDQDKPGRISPPEAGED
jgi:hypothetical protein